MEEAHKEPNAVDEADLEDGEIETDEESEIVESAPPAQPSKEKTISADGEAKKVKNSSDEDVTSSKKASSKHSKGDHHHRKSSSKATNNGGGGSGGNSSNKKNTTESSSSARKQTEGNFLFFFSSFSFIFYLHVWDQKEGKRICLLFRMFTCLRREKK